MRFTRAWCMGGALAVALWAGAAWAQSGTVSGTVTDSTGAPVSGAEVRVDGTMIHGLTDGQGRFTLSGVPAGSQTIRALLLGYKSARRSVTVEAGATITVDIRLE